MADDPSLEPRDRRRWHVDEIMEALAHIPADSIENWHAVINALKSAVQRKTAGLTDAVARDMIEKWSAGSAHHRDLDYYWTRAKKYGSRLGDLIEIAQRNGWARAEPPCSIENIRIQKSDPALFLVKIWGHDREVVMRAEDLGSRHRFEARVMNAVHRMVSYPTKDQLNRLMAEAESVPIDDSTTAVGQFRSALTRFLDEFLKQDRTDLDGYMTTWYDEATGRSWFRADDLIDWLKKERKFQFGHFGQFHPLTQAEIYYLVRALGGRSGVINLGKTKDGRAWNKRAWWVLINPRANVMEIDAPIIADDIEFDPVSKEARDLDRRRHFAQKREEESRARTERG